MLDLLEIGSVVVRNVLALLLGGANTANKYLDAPPSLVPIARAESLWSLFKCVLSDHWSLFQGWPSQGFSAVSNWAHCLNITVSCRPSKICHLHWNNATSKLCFWESFWLNEMRLEIFYRTTQKCRLNIMHLNSHSSNIWFCCLLRYNILYQ